VSPKNGRKTSNGRGFARYHPWNAHTLQCNGHEFLGTHAPWRFVRNGWRRPAQAVDGYPLSNRGDWPGCSTVSDVLSIGRHLPSRKWSRTSVAYPATVAIYPLGRSSLGKLVKMIEACRHDHNHRRPQARLGALAPVEFVWSGIAWKSRVEN
jgi:hypothetical protein